MSMLEISKFADIFLKILIALLYQRYKSIAQYQAQSRRIVSKDLAFFGRSLVFVPFSQ
jgi:hypothetical protein